MIEPLPYHREILDYLKREEADLWEWYSSTRFLAEYAEEARLELLKSTYRLDRGAHASLYATADDVLRRMGSQIPITLYQSQIATAPNASLSYLPGEAHVISGSSEGSPATWMRTGAVLRVTPHPAK